MKRLFLAMAMAAIMIISVGRASADSVSIDITDARYETLSSDTIRIRNIIIPGIEGKFYADFKWNGTALTFALVNAGFEEPEQPTIQYTVIAVADGDTITVLTPDNKQVRVRLYGIDAPEFGQDFGTLSKQFVSDMVFNETVMLQIHDTDRYGRTVADTIVGGRSLNEELVKAGMAWVYPQYCLRPECATWYRHEASARANKLGLWAHPNPIPPWEFRRTGSQPSADSVSIDITDSRYETLSSDTVRIRSIVIPGIDGKFYADFKWDGTALTFAPVNAGFEEPDQPTVQYTVTAAAGDGGSVTPAALVVSKGASASFTVTPSIGHTFSSVSGSCPSGSFSGSTYTTGSINDNCSVSFSFTQIQHTVTATAGTGGRVSLASRTVGDGSTASFTVTPDAGYTQGAVGGTCPNGSFRDNTYTTGAITQDCTLTFSFTQEQRTVTASAGTGGSVTPTSRTVGHGSTTTFTVTPNSGYSNGSVGGTCPTGTFSGNTYTTGSITENCNVLLYFVSRTGSYRGNTNSKIFHRSGCRYFNCAACTAVFSSRDAAIRAGYRPCKVCKP